MKPNEVTREMLHERVSTARERVLDRIRADRRLSVEQLASTPIEQLAEWVAGACNGARPDVEQLREGVLAYAKKHGRAGT